MKKTDKFIEYEKGKRVQLDEDDVPELKPQFFKKAKRGKKALQKIFGKKNTEKLLKRKVGRPVAEKPKKQVTLRVDPDVLAAYKAMGKGWQTRMQDALEAGLHDPRL